MPFSMMFFPIHSLSLYLCASCGHGAPLYLPAAWLSVCLHTCCPPLISPVVCIHWLSIHFLSNCSFGRFDIKCSRPLRFVFSDFPSLPVATLNLSLFPCASGSSAAYLLACSTLCLPHSQLSSPPQKPAHLHQPPGSFNLLLCLPASQHSLLAQSSHAIRLFPLLSSTFSSWHSHLPIHHPLPKHFAVNLSLRHL